jgi:hypothetical protein
VGLMRVFISHDMSQAIFELILTESAYVRDLQLIVEVERRGSRADRLHTHRVTPRYSTLA